MVVYRLRQAKSTSPAIAAKTMADGSGTVVLLVVVPAIQLALIRARLGR